MTPNHFAQLISSSSATGYKPFSGLFRFVGRWSVRLFLGRPTFLLPVRIYPWTSLRITNLKDAGSIPDGVNGIFIDILLPREALYNILLEFGIPNKLVRLVKMCLTETCSRVRVGKNLSDMFPIGMV